MRAWRRLAALLAVLLATAGPARAESLMADISEHLIAITTAFTGTDVVLFGTSTGGADIVVTVVGPREDQVVRRKSRIAGVWANRESLEFGRVPSYYAVASSAPLEQIARSDVLARHLLGVEHLGLHPIDAAGLDQRQVRSFQDALIRNKQRQGLYTAAPAPVNFLGPHLFRTTIKFPANVPPGIYQVQVFELEDGYVKDAQRSALVISKVGLEADVFDFAQQRAPLYGLLAIVMAVSLGWLAGMIFRRG